jgi:transaldolase
VASLAPSIGALAIQLFADGADRGGMLEMNAKPYIHGLTTNPTLMRKAGVTNYRAFAKDVLSVIREKPVCFEVFADDPLGMERQAMEIAEWADNVYVKIPVCNTRGEGSRALIGRLAERRVKVNVTAVMTLRQVEETAPVLNPRVPSFVSIFAGRIADTGIDPVPVVRQAAELLRGNGNARLIWASARELYNIFQADGAGCHAITLTGEILNKLAAIGRDLTEYSLETVRMFHEDARRAGYSL